MAETLKVETRPNHGKRHNRRLRRDGAIPAVLYGHGEEAVSLAVPRDAFVTALRHGTRLVELEGAVNESALIRDLQWDTYGTDVLHIDFARVSADEQIRSPWPVELRGQAPASRAGGVIQHLVHEIEIECLATAIPEKLQVNINHLGAEWHRSRSGRSNCPRGDAAERAEAIAVQCVEPAVEERSREGRRRGAEPEVIGRKADRRRKRRRSSEGCHWQVWPLAAQSARDGDSQAAWLTSPQRHSLGPQAYENGRRARQSGPQIRRDAAQRRLCRCAGSGPAAGVGQPKTSFQAEVVEAAFCGGRKEPCCCFRRRS